MARYHVKYVLPNRMNLSFLLVALFWGVQMGAKGFAIDTSNTVYHIISLILIPIVMLKIVFNNYNIKTLVRFSTVVFLACSIMMITGDTRALVITISIIALKDIPIEKLMKITFYVRGISFFLRIILCMFGVFDKQINLLGEYAFGFGHSNLAHGEYFCIFVSFLLWKLQSVRLYQLGVLNLVNILLFSFTTSRTPFILGILISAMVILRNKKWFQNTLCLLVPKVFIISFFITVSLSLLYYKLPFYWHSTFLSRFQTAFYMFRIYNLNLFGNFVLFLNDLGYVDILFTFGIPWTLFFIIGHTLLAKYFVECNNYILLSYLFIISMYFVMEAYAESVLYNYCWLYYSVLIFQKESPLEMLYLRFKKETL